MSVATIEHPEVMSYAAPSPGEADRATRAVLIAGVVHGSGCAMFLVQRIARWVDGDRDAMLESLTAFGANVGLLLQMVCSLLLVTACGRCLHSSSASARSRVTLAALLLGALWFAYGLLDGFPALVQYVDTADVVRFFLNSLSRELNQALVPGVLAFVLVRRRSADAITRAVFWAVIASCLLFSFSLVADYLQLRAGRLGLGWEQYRVTWTFRGLFIATGITLLIVRRPMRVLAALPLVLLLVRDGYYYGPGMIEGFRAEMSLTVFLSNVRTLSFFVVVSSAAITAFIVFTLFNVRRPSLISGAVDRAT